MQQNVQQTVSGSSIETMVKQINPYVDEMAALAIGNQPAVVAGRPQQMKPTPPMIMMVSSGDKNTTETTSTMSGKGDGGASRIIGGSIGRTVSCALMRAVYEKRVVVGVAAAVKELLSSANAAAEAAAQRSDGNESDDSCASNSSSGSSGGSGGGDVVFCVLAPAAPGDSASHMHTILLEAFCYENGIYIVKVDSARKLTRLLNARHTQTCALIQRPWHQDSGGGGTANQQQQHFEETPLSLAEETLIDHCEEYWDLQQPIVHLPD